MSENSDIGWTDDTFNLWQGCYKVSPGCKHCYAEGIDKRNLWSPECHWGRDAPRLFASERSLNLLHRWNRKAAKDGKRRKVFCSSMSDLFEVHRNPAIAAKQDVYRARLWRLIGETPWLD